VMWVNISLAAVVNDEFSKLGDKGEKDRKA
jgi:hypothetical protein